MKSISTGRGKFTSFISLTGVVSVLACFGLFFLLTNGLY